MRVKSHIISLIFVLCLLWITGEAIGIDYETIPLICLIGTSDIIISGSINTLTKDYFTVSLTEVLSGEIKKKIIKVRTYKSWSGPRGMDKIALQQTVILLLKQDKVNDSKTKSIWTVQGITGEGRLLTDKNYVYLPGKMLPNLEHKEYKIGEARIRAQRYEKSIFIAAVKDYRKSFVWEFRTDKKAFFPRKLHETKILEMYRTKSPLHQFLFDETQKVIKSGISKCGIKK